MSSQREQTDQLDEHAQDGRCRSEGPQMGTCEEEMWEELRARTTTPCPTLFLSGLAHLAKKPNKPELDFVSFQDCHSRALVRQLLDTIQSSHTVETVATGTTVIGSPCSYAGLSFWGVGVGRFLIIASRGNDCLLIVYRDRQYPKCLFYSDVVRESMEGLGVRSNGLEQYP